jgi:hypothetical protein
VDEANLDAFFLHGLGQKPRMIRHATNSWWKPGGQKTYSHLV